VVRKSLISQSSFEHGLMALLVLNLLDAFFTLGWVETGLATEANPVMAEAIEHGPAVFFLSKIFLVTLAVLLLWRNRERITARLAIVPVAALYAFVAGGHIGFAIHKVLEVSTPVVLALG